MVLAVGNKTAFCCCYCLTVNGEQMGVQGDN